MVLPSLVAASSAPSLASSPPARSSAVPIRRAGTSSRQSTTGAEERRLSFSVRTPVFVSVPSDAHSGGKPPAGPAPVKQVRALPARAGWAPVVRTHPRLPAGRACFAHQSVMLQDFQPCCSSPRPGGPPNHLRLARAYNGLTPHSLPPTGGLQCGHARSRHQPSQACSAGAQPAKPGAFQ